MIYVSSPSSSDQSQPPNPPFPRGGAGEFLPSTLNGRGLKVGRARVLQGWGVLALPLPVPTQSCPPILSSIPPLETEDLLFSIIYNLRLGPPVLSSPLT